MSEPVVFRLHERLEADTIGLGSTSLCEIRLMNDSTWPWVLLVPAVAGIREIYQLSAEQQRQLLRGIVGPQGRHDGIVRWRQDECCGVGQHGAAASPAPHRTL